ncbi:HNH endonuclease signature motif containing protein [Microcoleus sp. FACHB-672]|uniref:HNH endonuclease signature motif containing protein n=1 Tax=Microcoleus sp. FACHB-672 TaxID=2692825 RepID=UPI0016889E25|nr:HNH endonuclease [Microcoleus sp. FACHB-672]MBD2042328.1 HNH endonuclease [Microcoleus sp. FACHB-672]
MNPKAHGHYLILYSEGGSADLQNMMTLCPSCHTRSHNKEATLALAKRIATRRQRQKAANTGSQ